MGGWLSSSQSKANTFINSLQAEKKELVDQTINFHMQQSGVRPQHAVYMSPLGKIKSPDLCSHFDFKDPQSQILLNDAKFYSSIGFKEKVLQTFYKEEFKYKDLKKAIEFLLEKNFQDCQKTANQRKQKFINETKVEQQIASACCLVISFYTGDFQLAVERSSNLLVKLQQIDILQCVKDKKELRHQMCVAYWLFKATSYLPLHVNQATRAIDLSQDEQGYYNQGNLITWLQFSSGSQGNFVTKSMEKRNTRFHIFSITARKISAYSKFQQLERQVLFKPFSHFLILKKEKIGPILHIYMRQVVIGQAEMNILWVDDKIFSPNWKHKMFVEKLLRENPHITIIPKYSTKSAIAFMKSQLGVRRKNANLRIVTNLVRENEQDGAIAGVVLLKQLEDAYVTNLKILVLSDNAKLVELEMRKLVVRQPYKNISNDSEVLKSFVTFK